MRKNISSGSPWEERVGYSRAVRLGNTIEVSGTVSNIDGKIVGIGDLYAQTRCILGILQSALEEAGASMSDVVRTRMYVRDISQWKEAGRAHGEVFGDIQPATTMVEVSRLIEEEFLIEIEATAVVAASVE
ncbi:MAG: RidA family protein [Flavobacteriales bacterium]|nr:RidA family protein [Flavobacteriales bacterium]